MKRKLIHNVVLLVLLTVMSPGIHSQGDARMRSNIQLHYLKNTDDQHIIQAVLTCSSNSMELPLAGMEISFYSGEGGQKKLITGIPTGKDGVAKLDLDDFKLKAGNDGVWTVGAEFSGNDTIDGCASGVTFSDMTLEMTLSEADSIKTVGLKGLADEGGKEQPAAGITVRVLVPRMFSMLTIGEVTLDDAGTGTIEFPSDLPGDKEGNLEIIARIGDNEKYGNVEKRETVKWGLPVDYSVPVTHRALWTKIAPKWMIYTLSVLLAGVWGHYLYAIISLIRIRIDAARKKAKEEFRL